MDFIKNNLNANESTVTKTPRWRWFLLFLIFFLCVCFFSFVFYKKDTSQLSLIPDYYARLNAWIEDRKSHLHQGVVKVKHLSMNKEGKDSINFEFYTALPNMQIEVDDSEKEKSLPDFPQINKKQFASTKQNVIKAEELEKKLAHQLKQKIYILQLGVFQNAAAAEHYRKKLMRKGQHTAVIKTTSGKKTIFRIQQGPFLGFNQAKVAQKQLKKKGVDSLLRNMPAQSNSNV